MKKLIHYKLFHGTIKERSQQILKDGYNLSRGDQHWLGNGIYFYEQFGLANIWATKLAAAKFTEPVVLYSDVEIPKALILDLTNYNDRKRFETTTRQFYENYIATCGKETTNEQYWVKMRSALCNLFCEATGTMLIRAELQQNMDAENNIFMRKLGFSVNNQIQICLRNKKYVTRTYESESEVIV